MSRRRRSVAFALSAAVCALLAAALASGYRSRVDDELGALRPVLVATEPLSGGEALAPSQIDAAVEVRQVPESFAPPDPLTQPASLTGLAPASSVPAGSYLVRSQFAAPTPVRRGRAAPRAQGEAVQIVVSGAAPLAAGGLPRPVDVIVTTEPGPGGAAGRTYVAAERVGLLALSSLADDAGAQTFSPSGQFTATLDLDRSEALRLIQAESFARSVRLIAR